LLQTSKSLNSIFTITKKTKNQHFTNLQKQNLQTQILQSQNSKKTPKLQPINPAQMSTPTKTKAVPVKHPNQERRRTTGASQDYFRRVCLRIFCASLALH
jgi:hypothetical protein